MTEQVVGILGGMGPAATVDLMQRIINLTPASGDEEHLRVLIDNNPKVPSRIAHLVEGGSVSPAPVLLAMANALVAAGADFLAMPCNTAHHYYEEIASQIDVPFLNIVQIAGQGIRNQGSHVKKVGLLASSVLQQIDLYNSGFSPFGLEVLFPAEARQARVMDLILAIKGGRESQAQSLDLLAAAEDLEAQGADVLLIACTELSILEPLLKERQTLVLDASQLLAMTIVERASTG